VSYNSLNSIIAIIGKVVVVRARFNNTLYT
jgi:hypothetical protein